MPCKGEFITCLRVRLVNGWVAHNLNLRKHHIDGLHKLLHHFSCGYHPIEVLLLSSSEKKIKILRVK